MPRNRRSQSKAQAPTKPETLQDSDVAVATDDSTTVVTNSNANNGTSSNKKGLKNSMALTPDQIAQLLATSREKGAYANALGAFMESGEAGVSVFEEYPNLAGKKPETVKQGFENAKRSKDSPAGSEDIRVIKNDDQIYLVNPGLAGVDPGDDD